MKKLYRSVKKYLRILYNQHVLLITLISALIVLFIFIACGEKYVFKYWDFAQKHEDYITAFHDSSLSILTFLAVCGAWIQLANLNKTSRCDFLLRIEEQYSAQNMVDARKTIRKLHGKAIGKYKSGNIYIQDIVEEVAVEILKYKDSVANNDNYSNLIDFLNYLEGIAYFTNTHCIQYYDIKELSASAVTYYYDVYKKLIVELQNESGNKKLYQELQILSKKLTNDSD